VNLNCDCANVDLIWGTLLTFVWTDGARNSQSGYPDWRKTLKDRLRNCKIYRLSLRNYVRINLLHICMFICIYICVKVR